MDMKRLLKNVYSIEDLILYGKNDEELGLLNTVKRFCDNIGMKFSLKKYLEFIF